MSTIDSAEHYAADLITKKARELARSKGFQRHEVPDIEQELRAELAIKAPRFDPNRAAPTTYVAMIINRKVKSLVRERHAIKRGGAEAVHVGSSAAESLDWRRDRMRRDRAGKLEVGVPRSELLAHDLLEFIEGLPPEERMFCRRHLESGRFGCVAGTKAHRILESIRQRALAAGLGGYLVEGVDGVEDEAELRPLATAGQGRKSA